VAGFAITKIVPTKGAENVIAARLQ